MVKRSTSYSIDPYSEPNEAPSEKGYLRSVPISAQKGAALMPKKPFTDPWNLETAGVDSARDYYRQQNDQDVANGDVLGQAVHMGQAAQATIPDPMGLKGLMQALSERNAKVGTSFRGTNSTAYSPGGMRSTSLDALYDLANKKAKATGI